MCTIAGFNGSLIAIALCVLAPLSVPEHEKYSNARLLLRDDDQKIESKNQWRDQFAWGKKLGSKSGKEPLCKAWEQ